MGYATACAANCPDGSGARDTDGMDALKRWRTSDGGTFARDSSGCRRHIGSGNRTAIEDPCSAGV